MEPSSPFASDPRIGADGLWVLAPGIEPDVHGVVVPEVTVGRRLGNPVLAGDRFGAVPLFHRLDGRTLCVSTSPFLLPGPREEDPEALERARAGRGLEAHTLWKGIGRLRPGRRLAYADGAVRIEERARLLPSDEDPMEALRSAVARAAPDAVLLSGGLDSSALLALSVQLGRSPVALSVDDGASPGDLAAAAGVAERLGVAHEVVRLDRTALEAGFDRAVRACEVPLYDLKAVSKLLLYEAAAERGLRSLLSGTGADEVLLGHERLIGAADPRQARFRWVRGGFWEEALPLETTLGRRCGVRVSLPYLDDGFVAAMWYRPIEQLVRNGVGKLWLRDAIRGRLPDGVVDAPKRPVLVGGADPALLRARSVEVLLRPGAPDRALP